VKVRIIRQGGYARAGENLHKPGEVVDYPDPLALKLINFKIAVPVREKDVEKAVRKAPEKTSKGTVTTRSFSQTKGDD